MLNRLYKRFNGTMDSAPCQLASCAVSGHSSWYPRRLDLTAHIRLEGKYGRKRGLSYDDFGLTEPARYGRPDTLDITVLAQCEDYLVTPHKRANRTSCT